MFSKVSNKTLVAILLVLITVWGVSTFISKMNKESNFSIPEVEIDSAKISRISITGKTDNYLPVVFEKSETTWKIVKDNTNVEADENSVQSFISMLRNFKITRLAAKSKEKWNDFQVTDSLGTRLSVFQENEKVLDVIIGKFGFQQRSGISYIRFVDDDKVYALDGFIAMTINQGFNSWRNKVVVKSEKTNWNKLKFNYSDSSFVLIKVANRWEIEGSSVDSILVENYFTQLSSLTHGNFEDNFTEPQNPTYQLEISGDNMDSSIRLKAYQKNDNDYIVNSSQNKEANFKFSSQDIFSKLFVSKRSFVSEQ